MLEHDTIVSPSGSQLKGPELLREADFCYRRAPDLATRIGRRASCKTRAPFHPDSCHCCSSVEHIIANALEIEHGYRLDGL